MMLLSVLQIIKLKLKEACTQVKSPIGRARFRIWLVEGPDSGPMKCKELFFSQQTLLNAPMCQHCTGRRQSMRPQATGTLDLLSGHNEAGNPVQCSGPQVCILLGCYLQGGGASQDHSGVRLSPTAGLRGNKHLIQMGPLPTFGGALGS